MAPAEAYGCELSSAELLFEAQHNKSSRSGFKRGWSFVRVLFMWSYRKRKVSEKVVLSEGWSFAMDSFVQKCERKDGGGGEVVLREEWSLVVS